MKNMLTYYTLLGVSINATKEEIIRAYKEKAKVHHPDKNGNSPSSHELFQLLNIAKETLIDDAKRREYDNLAGIKIKSGQTFGSKNPFANSAETNIGAAVGIGLVGLLVGIAIGSSD